jgi:hypothetical protein
MFVKYSGRNVYTIGVKSGDSIRLMPGINEVSEGDLITLQSHPVVKKRVESGLIEFIGLETDQSGKRSISDMIKYIPQIFDVKTLEGIIENDDRDRVVKAAKKQLDIIKKPDDTQEIEEREHFK